MMTVVVAVGLGLLLGAATDEIAIGVGTGMMIAAMTLGIGIAPAVTRKLGEAADPDWVKRLILLGCAGPLILVANAPMFADFHQAGAAFLIAMVAVLLVVNWEKRRESGAAGELSFWTASAAAIFGMVATAIAMGIADEEPPEFMGMGAAIGGAVSLLTQAASWFLRRPAMASEGAGPGRPGSPVPLDEGALPAATPMSEYAPGPRSLPVEPMCSDRIPFGVPVEPGTPAGAVASTGPTRKRRSTFERSFFSLLTFVSLFGMIGNIIYPALVCGSEVIAHAMGAIMSFALLVFSAQKLTLWKRHGFWRETLLPFLISAFLISFGASVAAIATGEAGGGEEFAFAVIGIVFSATVLLVLLIMRVWPHRPDVRVVVARGMPKGGVAGAFVVDCGDACDSAQHSPAGGAGEANV